MAAPSSQHDKNPAETPPAGPSPHHSLALNLILEPLGEEEKSRVLDLGPALGGNVAFFSQFWCRLFIADLFDSIRSSGGPAPKEATALDKALEVHLPHSAGSRFDLILAWDLLNYLAPDEVEVLGRHLERLCRPGTRLFAMVSTEKGLPDLPLEYQILDRENLLYETGSPSTRACPRYKEPELSRLLPGFHVEITFLLRNGIQEYILTYGSPEEVETSPD